MVVHKAHSLHKGVAGGGADEGPAPPFEILAQRRGFGSGGELSGLGMSQTVLPRGGLELNEICVERTIFSLHFNGTRSIIDGGENLPPMADNSGVLQKSGDIALAEAGDLLKIEIFKGLPEIFALPENGEPAKTSLESFQTDLFEEALIINNSPSPLFVMITNVVIMTFAPPAAGVAIGTEKETVIHNQEKLSFRSSERYWIASSTCSGSRVSELPRSAMVRATFKIRS